MWTFDELLDRLVAGNDPAVGYVGTFSAVEDGAVVRERRIWRLRDLVRVEDMSGRGLMVAGDRRCWYAGDQDEPRDFGSLPAESEGLLLEPREHWSEWLSENPRLVASTLRPVRHEGRPAWSFTAPAVKGRTPVVTVDAELGIVLRIASEDGAYADTWTGLEVLPELVPDFFVPTAQDLAQQPDPNSVSEDRDPAELAAALAPLLHVLDGIVRALADPHALLDVVLAAADRDAAVAALEERLGLDGTQAHAVLDAQLQRMTEIGRARIVEQRDALARDLAVARARLGTP